MGLYAIKYRAEVCKVIRSEWTKYCPMLSVCDLLVIDAEYMFMKCWLSVLSSLPRKYVRIGELTVPT